MSSLYENLSVFTARRALERSQGRSTGGESLLAYSAESERILSAMPVIPNLSPPLQNPDGTWAFAVDPLGTGARIPGRYYIDSFGKFRSY